MIARTWEYGTTHQGKVITTDTLRNGTLVQMIEDLDAPGEAHVLVGSGDALAKEGDEGALVFCQGGPTGSYWRFRKTVVPKKPWPRDAVMIVCGLESEEVRRRIAICVEQGSCRDCGRAVLFSSLSREQANILAPGQPVGMFCEECVLAYDRHSIEKLEDLRT